jgi:superfamily II DNA or RNA helicase
VIAAEHVWWPAGRRTLRVVARTELWGRRVIETIDPAAGMLRRFDEAEVAPLADRHWELAEVIWRAAACRAIASAAKGAAVAAASSGVELLPHQASTVARALDLEPVRLALCDEVGLGKTITAAAIYVELKARGRAARALVVAPKGVQLQWVAEFADRFGEEFVRVGPEGMPVDVGVDPWRAFPQIVCSLDAVKPIRARAGWSVEQVDEYNRRRVHALTAAGWDLVIFDEAHHVAGSSDEVARHRLARELSAGVPNVLLLSATPHSGKSDGFRRFVGLLDDEFFAGAPLTKDRVQELVARTEKRTATDLAGQPLFMPRTTTMEVVRYSDRTVERELYDSVTEYVREGYGRAVREKRPAIGFLVLLMQRLVSSSSAAILTALEKRIAALDASPEQLELGTLAIDWEELTGEEQLERLVELRGHGWASERVEVQDLLQLARRAASSGLDAKVRHLFDLLRSLETHESDPDVKVLVFTEFLPTQDMLLAALRGAGISAVAINGGMSLAERALAQEAFRTSARVLVSTDAGGEGINLQFAHVVVNWDLPWTPTKIEQRIGRVDRIGQRHPVKAFNLVRENSIDMRVLEVLERKLATILAELGADKRGDVLESLSTRSERLYVDAILEPDTLERSADDVTAAARDEVVAQAPTLELMVPRTLKAAARTDLDIREVVRRASEARSRVLAPGAPRGATLDALRELPTAAPGEPVPMLPDAGVAGWWGCFEVADAQHRRTCFALFAPDGDGLVRPDVAERCWSILATTGTSESGPPPESAQFDAFVALGRDHGYRAWANLGSDGVPELVLRLLVRVTR